MKILFIPSHTPEELMFSTPIIRALSMQKKATIDVVLENTYLQAFEGNPYIKSVKSITAYRSSDEVYEVVIDLRDDKLSRKIRKQFSAKYRTRKNYFNDWLYINLKVNRLPNNHLVDQYFELLHPLGIENDNEGLDFFIPDKDFVENEWLPKSHRNGYVVFTISSPTTTQQLPTERMIELCDRINKPIILIGGKADQKKAEVIERFFKKGTEEEEKAIEDLNKKTSIFNACGKFNLNQFASIIKNSSWVFTHENIYMQIAAAFKKQVFSIWGSSTPFFGRYPYETKFTVFENNKLNCRPCSRTGFDNCPKGHFKCMNDMTFDFYLPD